MVEKRWCRRRSACLAAGVVGLFACGGTGSVPTAGHGPPAAPPTATACSPPPVEVTIEERQRVFQSTGQILQTPHWQLHRGYRWPGRARVVAFISMDQGRIEHLVPGDSPLSSPGGTLLVLGRQAFVALGDGPPKGLDTGLSSATFSPDERRVFGIHGDDVMVIDTTSRAILARRTMQREAELEVVSWKGDQILLQNHDGAYAVVRASDLHLTVPTFYGAMSPSGARVAAIEDDQADPPMAKLQVVDGTTGTVLYRRTIDSPGYTRAGRALFFTSDDKRLVWQGRGALMLLDLATKRIRKAPYLELGEADAESDFLGAPSADGRHVCFAMDTEDRTYDLRARRAREDRPGRAVRCLIDEHLVAHVVQVPLKAHEIVLDFPGMSFGNHPDFALSADGRLAGVLVTDGRIDPMAQRPLALLVVEVGRPKIRHRVDLGHMDAGGGAPHLQLTEDGRTVDMSYQSWHDYAWRVDLETGEKTRPPPKAPAPQPSAQAAFPPVPRFEVDHAARAMVRGATVLWQGRELTHAWRLDEEGRQILAPRKDCTARLSPRGERVLRHCVDQSKAELLFLDGGPPKTVPEMGLADCFAAADDGAVAWATESTLHVMADGARMAIELVQASGPCTGLAWAPDGQSVAAWQAGAHTLFLVDRGDDTPRWTRRLDPVVGEPRMRFTADGRYVLLGQGSWRKMLGVLNVQDGSDSPFDRADAVRSTKNSDGSLELGGLVPYGNSKLSPVTLQQPLGHRWPSDGSIAAAGQIVITAHEGVVRLHRIEPGEPIATLLPLLEGGAVVLFEDGRIDWLGKPAAPVDLICLRGERVVPPHVCSSSTDRGALARTLQKGTEAELPPCPASAPTPHSQ